MRTKLRFTLTVELEMKSEEAPLPLAKELQPLIESAVQEMLECSDADVLDEVDYVQVVEVTHTPC